MKPDTEMHNVVPDSAMNENPYACLLSGFYFRRSLSKSGGATAHVWVGSPPQLNWIYLGASCWWLDDMLELD